jgi:uncharacterized protein (UPF0210 family)
MRIRTITSFYDPTRPDAEKVLDRLAAMTASASKRYENSGYEVQTTRLATVPFPYLAPSLEPNELAQVIQSLETQSAERGFAYISFGPALPEIPESYQRIPDLIAITENAFFSGIIAHPRTGVEMAAVRACGDIIARAAKISPDGFSNLRFTALANVPPMGPFFPAAYHDRGEPAFALAIESADLALDAFSGANSLDNARTRLLQSIESHARVLETVSEEIAASYGLRFVGMDFSLAPFPQDWCSLGGAIEELGIERIGLQGSLAAAAFVADTLDRGRWLKTGFNGLMLPVLEDSILARRTIEGTLTVKDLLLYSTVCGTGLDTVPLPGDASAEEISALLADIAALSIRLDKPLTGRLMPVPGKKAGDMTEFDFDFFVNGRILDLPARTMKGLLARERAFDLKARHS